MSESLLLAGAGACLGTMGAHWAVRVIAQLVWTGNVDAVREVPLDGNVVLFTAAIAVISGLLFGAISAWRAVRIDPWTALRQPGRTVSGGAAKVERLFVVAQVAVSLLLIVAATLFTGSLRHLRTLARGLDSSHVLGIQVMNRPGAYRGLDPVSYYSGLYGHLAGIPGIRSVSSASIPPLFPPVFPDQTLSSAGTTAGAQSFLVAPGYFETLQIPLTAGRDFSFRDTGQTHPVAIVSESLARSLFGFGDVIGRQLTIAGEEPGELTVIGVVSDSQVGSLQKHNPRQLFRTVFQVRESSRSPYILIRTSRPPSAALIEQVRKEIEAAGREYPIRTETMERAIARALVQERLMASLAGGFGILALLMAAAGLYGLMSYSVVQRTREIGIRMALGANGQTILSMVIRECLLLVTIGFAVSAPAVYAGTRVIASMLHGLEPLDPIALGTAAAVLVCSALVAVYIPARRASRLNSMAALRCE